MGYAIGPLILKHRLVDLDARATMGGSLAVAALLGAHPQRRSHGAERGPVGGSDLVALVLGLVCTALAFVIFNLLIADAGPGRALVITYVNPVVAVALGVTLLDEHPGAGAVAGLLLILVGSWLSTDDRLPPRRRARVELAG